MLFRLDEAAAAEIFLKKASKVMSLDQYKVLLGLDPTYVETEDFEEQNKGKYTMWLVDQYILLDKQARSSALDEDADQIRKGIELFIALSRNKEGREFLSSLFADNPKKNIADIQSYSIGDIRFLSSSADQAEGQDVKLENRIEVLFNGKELFVCKPLTHEASRKYGTGTNWCTAVSNPNWFNRYNARGGLFIIIDKADQSNKWQLAKAGEFRDKKDRGVAPSQFVEYAMTRSKTFQQEADEVIRIFAEEEKIEAWSVASLLRVPPRVQRVIDLLETRGLDELRNLKLNDLYFISNVVLIGEIDVARYLIDNAGFVIPPDDLTTLIQEGLTEDALRLSTMLSAEDIMDSLVRVTLLNEKKSLDNYMRPVSQKVRSLTMLFERVGTAIPYERRVLLATLSPMPIISVAFIKELLKDYLGEREQMDRQLANMYATLYPELRGKDPLREAYFIGNPDVEQWTSNKRKELIATIDSKRAPQKTLSIEALRAALLKVYKGKQAVFPAVFALLSPPLANSQRSGIDNLDEYAQEVAQSIIKTPGDSIKLLDRARRATGLTKARPEYSLIKLMQKAVMELKDADWESCEKWYHDMFTQLLNEGDYISKDKMQSIMGELEDSILWISYPTGTAYNTRGRGYFAERAMAAAMHGATSKHFSIDAEWVAWGNQSAGLIPPPYQAAITAAVKSSGLYDALLNQLEKQLSRYTLFLSDLAAYFTRAKNSQGPQPELANKFLSPIHKAFAEFHAKETDPPSRGLAFLTNGACNSSVIWSAKATRVEKDKALTLMPFAWQLKHSDYDELGLTPWGRFVIKVIVADDYAKQLLQLVVDTRETIKVVFARLQVDNPNFRRAVERLHPHWSANNLAAILAGKYQIVLI